MVRTSGSDFTITAVTQETAQQRENWPEDLLAALQLTVEFHMNGENAIP